MRVGVEEQFEAEHAARGPTASGLMPQRMLRLHAAQHRSTRIEPEDRQRRAAAGRPTRGAERRRAARPWTPSPSSTLATSNRADSDERIARSDRTVADVSVGRAQQVPRNANHAP